MKRDRKLFLLLLSAVLVMALVPMIAFGGEGEYWFVEAASDFLCMGKTQTEITLEVVPSFYYYDEGETPELYYQWYRSTYKDGVSTSKMIEGANDRIYIATSTGNYECEVSDEAGTSKLVGFCVDYEPNEFQKLTAKLKKKAAVIRVGNEVTVNTAKKDGLFKFVPKKSGTYYFYSRHIGKDEESSVVNPQARILNAKGKTIKESYSSADKNFKLYFSAKAGKTYYLQAINLERVAKFSVVLTNDDIDSITFQQKSPYVLDSGLNMWTFDSEGESNIPEGVKDGDKFWSRLEIQEGDRLILNKRNGSSVIYEAKLRGRDWLIFKNVKNENDTIPDSKVKFTLDRYWAPEKTYPVGTESEVEVEVTYQKHSVKALCKVKFTPNPYSDILIEGPIKAVTAYGYPWTTNFSGTTFYITKNGTKLKYEPETTYNGEADFIRLINHDTGDQLRVNIANWAYVSGEGFWEAGKTYPIRLYFSANRQWVDAQVETEEIPFDCKIFGHLWNGWEYVKEPTYTEEGIVKYTCAVCGETMTDTRAKLAKKTNPLAVKAVNKSVKASNLKNKALTVSGAVRITKEGVGALTYSGAGTTAKAKKALKIDASTGKITVKKGTEKGTYKMKVTVKASGSEEYNVGSKTVTVTITVK